MSRGERHSPNRDQRDRRDIDHFEGRERSDFDKSLDELCQKDNQQRHRRQGPQSGYSRGGPHNAYGDFQDAHMKNKKYESYSQQYADGKMIGN